MVTVFDFGLRAPRLSGLCPVGVRSHGRYELESTKGPDAAAQAIRLKVGLLLMMFFISVSFYTSQFVVAEVLSRWVGCWHRRSRSQRSPHDADAGLQNLVASHHLGDSVRADRSHFLSDELHLVAAGDLSPRSIQLVRVLPKQSLKGSTDGLTS